MISVKSSVLLKRIEVAATTAPPDFVDRLLLNESVGRVATSEAKAPTVKKESRGSNSYAVLYDEAGSDTEMVDAEPALIVRPSALSGLLHKK
jgi:hypothetical protein